MYRVTLRNVLLTGALCPVALSKIAIEKERGSASRASASRASASSSVRSQQIEAELFAVQRGVEGGVDVLHLRGELAGVKGRKRPRHPRGSDESLESLGRVEHGEEDTRERVDHLLLLCHRLLRCAELLELRIGKCHDIEQVSFMPCSRNALIYKDMRSLPQLPFNSRGVPDYVQIM